MGSESEDEDFVAGSESDVNEEFNEDYSSGSEAEDDGTNKPKSSQSEEDEEEDEEVEEVVESKPPSSKPKARKPKTDDLGQPKKKVKKEKKVGPKRALTSFLYFSQDKRQSIKDANPSFTLGDIGKELGRLWKECTGPEKEKYEEMAAKDKIRYQRELEHFKKTGILPDGTKVPLNSSNPIPKPTKKQDIVEVKKENKAMKSEEFVNDEEDDF